MKYIFGPVNSRRLGLSLGVDLMPAKICNFDCIYCEVGVTTSLTVKRREYVSTAAVISELEGYLKGLSGVEGGGKPDVITITGAGEPALHSGIGRIIGYLKDRSDIPVAVLTNGSLMRYPQVRLDLLAADIVVPSLDSVRRETYALVNRPVEECADPEEIVKGLAAFAEEFGGELWLEVLLVNGINDGDEDVAALNRALAEINPDLVQLNTVVRPPAEEGIKPVTEQRMREIAGLLSDHKVEIIASFSGRDTGKAIDAGSCEIIEMLSRRPCTGKDIGEALGLEKAAVQKKLHELAEAGRIREKIHDGRTYYQTERQK